MDILTLTPSVIGIIIGLSIGYGLCAAARYAAYRVFRRDILAEKKFHLLTGPKGFKLVKGARQEPLKVADAEAHLKNVRKFSREISKNIVGSSRILYGSGKGRKRTKISDLDRVRSIALNSQQSALLHRALKENLDDGPLMGLIAGASTEKELDLISKAMDRGGLNREDKINGLKGSLAKLTLSERTPSSEVVLISKEKLKVLPATKEENDRLIDGLPEGYRWWPGTRDKGKSYEKVTLSVINPRGYEAVSGSFYKSHYSDHQQKYQMAQLKAELIRELQYSLAPGGMNPEVRAVLKG